MKLGDVVYLKSGGPAMTVRRITVARPQSEVPEMVECTWFAGGQPMIHGFPVDVLTDEGPPSLRDRPSPTKAPRPWDHGGQT